MIRTVEEIKQLMTSEFIADTNIIAAYGLDPLKTFEEQFSKASPESNIFHNVAYCSHINERIFESERQSIIDYVENMRPHNCRWYYNKILAFQFGRPLAPETDTYDEIVESEKIVKYCSVRDVEGFLYIKAAKQVGDSPFPLTTGEYTALKGYIDRVRDAGVHYELISYPPDNIKLKILINYDPLILRADGTKLSDNTSPVGEAIKNYLKQFPFDGIYSNMALTDAIQQAEGVRVVQILECLARAGTNPFTPVISTYYPDSGYLSVLSNSDIEIQYV